METWAELAYYDLTSSCIIPQTEKNRKNMSKTKPNNLNIPSTTFDKSAVSKNVKYILYYDSINVL